MRDRAGKTGGARRAAGAMASCAREQQRRPAVRRLPLDEGGLETGRPGTQADQAFAQACAAGRAEAEAHQ